tara:strand:- start:14 stop:427 length:414 start_codon:yes stop_codon:yes gene_type:complete
MEWKNRLNGLNSAVTSLPNRQRVALALGVFIASGFLFWDAGQPPQSSTPANANYREMDEFISLFDQPETEPEETPPDTAEGASPAEQIIAEAELPPNDSMTPLIMNSDSQSGRISTASGSHQNERPIRLTGTIYPIK